MKLFLLADVGSTWTKLTAVDSSGKIVGSAKAPTTANTDVMLGFNQALSEIEGQTGKANWEIHACSSAAGGLTMVACGLVPDLTGQAAKLAVLGAGAKVLKVFGYNLIDQDVQWINQQKPDMLLLAGGTDGGNRQILLNNAKQLAQVVNPLPVILAGNRDCAHEAAGILQEAGFPVEITGNVMPELNKLDIEPARKTIRELFLRHIVGAKGMISLSKMLASPLVPTPAAVMAGGSFLANEMDELLLVDIGGATTDVYSFGADHVSPGMMRKGLPPPREMRTVEADIGMRHSLPTLVEQIGLGNILADAHNPQAWRGELDAIIAEPGRLVGQGLEDLETRLAQGAVRIAIQRHAGNMERIYTPTGSIDLLYGKDLRSIKNIVGVGGALVNSSMPAEILSIQGEGLMPQSPKLMLDKNYIMAAAGLLADKRPQLAQKLLADSVATLQGGL